MKTSYQKQLHYIFDRPVTEKPWYWSPREEEEPVFEESNPLEAFEFIERLCLTAKTDLVPFSDDQVGVGLDFVFNYSGLASDFKQASVSFERREQAIRSLAVLFRELLDPRCKPQTSAYSKEIDSELNNFCYMFWDVCPWSNWFDYAKIDKEGYDDLLEWSLENLPAADSDDPILAQSRAFLKKLRPESTAKKKTAEEVVAGYQQQFSKLDAATRGYYEAIAYVMQECLQMSNPACVESGLHGLGHMVPFLPDIALPIIDQYLKNKKNTKEHLVQYAQAARTGMIL
ncbi:MAG: hypothetical protein ABIQ93_04940 [Saprospiraceae bacterium]